MTKLHIPSKSDEKLATLKNAIDIEAPVFVLVYGEGCGHCTVMRPEWNIIGESNPIPDNVYVVDIEQSALDGMSDIPPALEGIMGVPTIRYITNKGNTYDDFKGERTASAFEDWINLKTNENSDSTNKDASSIAGGGRLMKKLKRMIIGRSSKHRSSKPSSYKSKTPKTPKHHTSFHVDHTGKQKRWSRKSNRYKTTLRSFHKGGTSMMSIIRKISKPCGKCSLFKTRRRHRRRH